jgi:septal ring-binding cell division protein DamX
MKVMRGILVLGIIFSGLYTIAGDADYTVHRVTFQSLDNQDQGLSRDSAVAAVDDTQDTTQDDTPDDENPTATSYSQSTSGFSVRLVPISSHAHPHSHLLATAKHSSPMGAYTVQLSSYLTEAEARTQMAQMGSTLNDTWILTATVDGKNRFRVCSGHFQTWKEAQAARPSIVTKSGIKQAFVQKLFSSLTAKN